MLQEGIVRACLHFYLFFMVQVACLGRERGFAMAKAIAVCALCIASAALGAGIDHYFGVAIEQGGPQLERAVSSKAAVAAPAEMNVEVLGEVLRT